MADPGLGQGKYKTALGQLVPKSKNMLQECWRRIKEQRSQMIKRAPIGLIKLWTSKWKIWDYYPTNKVKTYESVQVEINNGAGGDPQRINEGGGKAYPLVECQLINVE